jgi:hypothetical protein
MYWATSSQKVFKNVIQWRLIQKEQLLVNISLSLAICTYTVCTAFRTLPRALHSLQLRLPRSSQVYKVPVAVVHRSQ